MALASASVYLYSCLGAILNLEITVSQNTLLDHIRQHIPGGFVTFLAQHQPQVYPEAAASAFNDPRWTQAEGRMLVGDIERAIFENIVRKAAKKYKLRVSDVDHNGGNSSCIHVFAGNLRLTTHRVPSPNYFVRPCESRKQDSAVNKFMDGYVLEGSLSAPLPALDKAEEIRLFILQGSVIEEKDGKEERRSFIQLAAPDAALVRYRWICSFGELQQAYLADARDSNREQEQETRVLPRLKKDRKTENE